MNSNEQITFKLPKVLKEAFINKCASEYTTMSVELKKFINKYNQGKVSFQE